MIQSSFLEFLASLETDPKLVSQISHHSDELNSVAIEKLRDHLSRCASGEKERTKEITENSVYLYERENVVCSIRKLSTANPGRLFMIPRMMAMLVLKGSLSVTDYKIVGSSETFDPDAFDKGAVAVETGRQDFSEGEVYTRLDPFTLSDIAGDGLAISVYAGLFGRIDWIFSATGNALGAIASDPRDTDMEAMLIAAEAISPIIKPEPVTALLAHQTFFVRWAALKALNAIAPEQTEDALHLLATDRHREIADTAQHLLKAN